MKITVSITEELYLASAKLARRLGLTRGALYGRAIEEYLDRHEEDVHVNPFIRDLVEPILAEEVERDSRKYATVADTPISPEAPPLAEKPLPSESPDRV